MKKILLLIILLAAFSSQLKAQGITGSWLGSIAVSGINLRLAFNIKKTGDTVYSSTFDSPDQKAFGIPASKTYEKNDSVYIEIAAAGIHFKGALTPKHELFGTFKQGSASFPLEMRYLTSQQSAELAKDPLRPQTPKPPYGYYSEDVSYKNAKDTSLYYGATFTRPNGKGKYPAVVIISGSGTQDRDGTLFGHKLYLVLADYLTKNGIAVLRIDDRGAGKSSLGKDFRNATSLDFSYDVETSLNYLETRDDVDKKHLGLIGHSEGGIIAPMVAARRRDVSFIILWGAPAIGGIKTLDDQNYYGLRKAGIDSLSAMAFVDLGKQIFEQFKVAVSTKELDKKIITIFTDWKLKESPLVLSALKVNNSSIIGKDILSLYNGLYSLPWMRFFLNYNPSSDLGKIKCPVLAVNGKLDTQVDARDNLSVITQILTKSGNRNFETVAIPGLNHLLQPALTGDFSEYAKIDTTMSPVAMDIICRWIKLHAK